MRRVHPLLKRRSLAVSVSQRGHRRGGNQPASLLPHGRTGAQLIRQSAAFCCRYKGSSVVNAQLMQLSAWPVAAVC